MIGNSITFRTPQMEGLGWAGMWGVAATAADKDWVHQVWAGIAARQGNVPDMRIISVTTPEIPAEVVNQIRAYRPDMLIVQWGEVGSWDASQEWWDEQYIPLGDAAIDIGAHAIVIGVWGNESGDPRNERIAATALASGMTFVQISDLHTTETEATMDSVCTSVDVCWHPGNRGMALIAERILEAIYPQATYLPFAANGQGGTVPVGE